MWEGAQSQYLSADRSHAPRGNAARDALRHKMHKVQVLRACREAERPGRHSHAERGNEVHRLLSVDRSHAPRGNAARDALRHKMHKVQILRAWRDAERPWRHSHAERGNEVNRLLSVDRSHAPRGNAARDAPRPKMHKVQVLRACRDAERPWRHSHAEHGNEVHRLLSIDRSHAPRGNAARDAPRHKDAQGSNLACLAGRGASMEAFPRRAWERGSSASEHRSFPRSAWECSP
jgi:uncharacterized protein (UPF0297 family)